MIAWLLVGLWILVYLAVGGPVHRHGTWRPPVWRDGGSRSVYGALALVFCFLVLFAFAAGIGRLLAPFRGFAP